MEKIVESDRSSSQGEDLEETFEDNFDLFGEDSSLGEDNNLGEDNSRGEENINDMASRIEPPTFVSDKKSYAAYKADLKMWSRITSLEKKVQAEMVVYCLEGDPSRIKEKITTQLGEKLVNNEDGINELIKFLDTIYTKDDMADAWDKFGDFNSFTRKQTQSMGEFIADWENCYYKAKTVGCVYSDMILAFKLLKDSKVDEMETKLILTGVDYSKGKEKEDLLKQMSESLKKFKGRSVISDEDKGVVKSEDTFISEMESVLLAKGWKPPNKERRRSRSESPAKKNKNQSIYKGKKNKLDANFLPLKCFICKCDHKEKCNCPCVYHFADNCPNKKVKDDVFLKKPELGLFIRTNIKKAETVLLTGDKHDDEFVLVVDERIEELVLNVTTEKSEALIDCACPTTVTGKTWMEDFFLGLREEDQRKVTVVPSEKVYKFGGGEKRKSLGKVVFPCHLAGKNVKMTTEVVHCSWGTPQ